MADGGSRYADTANSCPTGTACEGHLCDRAIRLWNWRGCTAPARCTIEYTATPLREGCSHTSRNSPTRAGVLPSPFAKARPIGSALVTPDAPVRLHRGIFGDLFLWIARTPYDAGANSNTLMVSAWVYGELMAAVCFESASLTRRGIAWGDTAG
jgi:hypothetical protein